MKTSIAIDADLINNAMRVSGLKTKREVIAQALLEFTQNREKPDLRELPGTVEFADDYDYKATRGGVRE